MIHIRRFSRVVGAQPLYALFRDLDVAVRWLRPAMGAGILKIFFQEVGRRIPWLVRIKDLYLQIEGALIVILFEPIDGAGCGRFRNRRRGWPGTGSRSRQSFLPSRLG
jgi:hypothetical protein